MRTWIVCALALGFQIPGYAKEDGIRPFRAVDPIQLDKKVPHGFGQVFVDAARKNNIDPLILAAISAHESGAWRSKAARIKHNWMGLVARGKTKRFATPDDSIYYAADLLNRAPFKGRNTLSGIASVYCTSNPGSWKKEVIRWCRRLEPHETGRSAAATATY
jgi:Mannosyl-glycoprotein endo-beta-N-acetylglucosaminidase